MNFRPTIRKISVPLQQLLLDPNNPRFLEDHAERVDEKSFHDGGVQTQTFDRMNQEKYHLEELRRSIESNGWQPVDMMFVRKVNTDYVVLEGNRRLMALRSLKKDGKLTGALKESVDPLAVLEIVGAGDDEEVRNQIAYLLGVRHQSSLKTWGPFAQAHDIYGRYLRLGKMTDATFKWDEALAAKVGATLTVDVKRIQERLRVYRAMKQLDAVPAINAVGIVGKYYSLVKEAVAPGGANSPLRTYIVQNPVTFVLDEPSVARMDAVCAFSTPKDTSGKDRPGAPVSSPDEWRPLAKILSDSDPNRRAAMIHDIEVEKKSPSDVHAARQAELRQPRWDRWLAEVAQLLNKLQIANLDGNDGASRAIATRLAAVLDTLSSVTATGRE